jgi:hypothetical protein
MKTINEQISNAMAKAFFACAWSDLQDEKDSDDSTRVNLSGREIMDVMPDEIDPAALHAAFTLACGLRIDNDVTALDELFVLARSLPTGGYDRALTPELFGHYLAMQAMGHGVGLESFGYSVYEAIKVPYVEFGSHSLEKDY